MLIQGFNMAVILYIANENGDKEHKGVKYSEGRFMVKRMKGAMAGGYVCNLDELLPKVEYKEPTKAEINAEKAAGTPDTPPPESEVSNVESSSAPIDSPNEDQTSTDENATMSNEEIRKAAHEAGIDGYETKRIETLKSELQKVA